MNDDRNLRLRDRSTSDLVVIFLAGLVGFMLVVSILGIIALEMIDYHINTDLAVARISAIVNTLVGSIIGFVAGKGASSQPPRRRGEPQ